MRARCLAIWAGWIVCGGPALAQERFDPMTLRIEKGGHGWQLLARQRVLKEFTRSEDAQKALNVLRELRVNQQVTVGGSRPIIEFWLSDGRAPSGLGIRRLPTIPFDRHSLKVESKQGQWLVRDACRPLFVFGDHEADARQALALLQQHEFNRVGYVGNPPTMMFFVQGAEVKQGNAKPTKAVSPLASLPLPALGASHPLQFAIPAGENREAITWQRCELLCENAAWKLIEGRRTLLELGGDPKTARDALQVLRHYRFSEQCRTGTSPHSFRCFLVDGQAPRGLMFGVSAVPFRPEQLTVRQFDDRWMLCQGDSPLLPAGASAEEAQHALQLVRKYGFDRLCWVGSSQREAFRFLVKER